ALTFENEIYAIPRDGYGLGLLINKRILGENDLLPQNEDGTYSLYKEDGMPAYPTTFEEIYEMSKAISENDSASGFLMYTTNKNGGWVFSNIAWNFGSTLEKKADGKVVADFNEDSTVKALTWLQNMAKDGCLFPGNGIVYNDWYSKIGSKVAMAVVGSDVLQEAKLQGKVDMGDLAFVPMPTGDGTHHYSLYGGTPFVFSKNTSDEKVDGILEFFNYIGRSPEVSDINFEAKKTGYETAKAKGQPILPTIMPWSGEEYLAKAKALEDSYINVNMEDYSPFFDTIQANKKTEEPYCAQDMYKALDEVIQALIDKPFTASPKALLETATASFQKTLDASLGQ
ncbi:MAG TPA: hypothetical protein DCZ41_02345, partial [Firmicutes bacterium]|nr:hypothetical protein [Bacillota bacterium]